MKIGILGSGFGLYGYLPAIIQNGHLPVTLEKYRSVIMQRSDLRQFIDQIDFVADRDRLIKQSAGALVLAVPPFAREEFLDSLSSPYEGHLFLEKPFAISVKGYSELLRKLEIMATTWSIAYLFPYTVWYKGIQGLMKESQVPLEIDLHWTLPKPISRDDWKNDSQRGGGEIAYYLTHFIPFLRQYDFDESDFFRGENNEILWEISKFGPPGYKLNIHFGHGKRQFKVSTRLRGIGVNPIPLFHENTPFGSPAAISRLDIRASVLQEYMRTSLENPSLATQNQLNDSKAINALSLGHETIG